MKKKFLSFIVLVVFLMVSSIFAEADRVYLFNGVGDVGTLSKIQGEQIDNDFISVGMWPNDMKHFDSKLYVVNSGNNNVQVIDEPTLTNLGAIEVTANSNPMNIAFAGGKIYVTNTYGTGIDVIDQVSQEIITTITLTDALGGSDAIISVGDFVYANKNNYYWDTGSSSMAYEMETIVKIDPTTDTIVAELEVGVNISKMLVDNQNELHILCTGNRDDIYGYVKVIDLNTFTLNSETIELGSQPGSFVIDSNGMIFVAISGYNPDYTAFGGIMKYNSINNEVINNSSNLLYESETSGILDIGIDNMDLLIVPLFSANELAVLDVDGNELVTFETGNGPQGVIFITDEVEIDDNYQLSIVNYQLEQNYPNPFNPSTNINYELRITNYELAEIVVHNSSGQIVGAMPVAHPSSATNNHGSVQFDGSKLNSGVYYYSLVVDGKRMSTKSMILMK